MKQNFYLHFETKPSFSELDRLFDCCEAYEPVMANSYVLVFNTDGKQTSFFDLIHQIFPRQRYALVQFAANKFRQTKETPYVPTGI